MKENIIVILSVFFYSVVNCQSPTTCDLCKEMMSIAQTETRTGSEQRIYQLVKTLIETEKKNSLNKDQSLFIESLTSGGWFDGDAKSKRTQEEYERLKQQGEFQFESLSKEFLETMYVNARAWQSIDFCIEKCSEAVIGRSNKPIIEHRLSRDGKIELRIKPGGIAGEAIRLSQFSIENVKFESGVEIKQYMDLQSGVEVISRYRINNPCMGVKLVYRFDNMQSAVDYNLPPLGYIKESGKVVVPKMPRDKIVMRIDRIEGAGDNKFDPANKINFLGHILFYVENNTLMYYMDCSLSEDGGDYSNLQGRQSGRIPYSVPEGYTIFLKPPAQESDTTFKNGKYYYYFSDGRGYAHDPGDAVRIGENRITYPQINKIAEVVLFIDKSDVNQNRLELTFRDNGNRRFTPYLKLLKVKSCP